MHTPGVQAAKLLEGARDIIAEALGCESREVYFTSGGTESDNWAIKGAAYSMKKKNKNHIISTVFEHHAVLHTLQSLEKEGFDVTYLKVNDKGYIDARQVQDAITENTGLVTVMYANNEIGTILPIKEIGEICRKNKIIFHTDAVQAVGNIPVNVVDENIDLLSLSAHKFHGPKGIGALYIRKGVVIPNLLDGGGQERGKRGGTENSAAAFSMAVALQESIKDMQAKNKRLSALRDRLIEGLLKIEKTHLNGGVTPRLPGNVSVCFEGVEGESLLLSLDLQGINASSGSACTSGSLDPSHVLLALGLTHEVAHGSLRLSLGRYNNEEDVDYILEVIPGVVDRLRDMSPLWESIKLNER